MGDSTGSPGFNPFVMLGEGRLYLSFLEQLGRSAALDRLQAPEFGQRNYRRRLPSEMYYLVGLGALRAT